MENNKFNKDMGFREVQKAMDERIARLAARVDDMEAKRHEAITKAMEMYDKEIQVVRAELDVAQQTKSALVVQKSKDSSAEMVEKCEAAALPKPTQSGFAGGVGISYGDTKIPAGVVRVVESWVSAKLGRFTRADASAAMREKFPAYSKDSAAIYAGAILKKMRVGGRIKVNGKNGNVVQYITEESFAKLKNDDIAVLGEKDMAHPLGDRTGEST